MILRCKRCCFNEARASSAGSTENDTEAYIHSVALQ